MTDLAVTLATDIFTSVIPFVLVFGISEFIVSVFVRVAFGGRFTLR